MDLSVIVVNYNTKELTKKCLDSIFGNTKGVHFEVIVVDNNSEDGSAQMLQKYPEKIKLIKNTQNLGFAKANNQAIKIAKGKYVMLLNSDAYLIENSLKALVEKANLEKNLGMLGPQVLNEDKTIQQSAGHFPNLLQVIFWMSFLDDLPGGTLLNPYHIDHDSFYKKEHEVGWLTGAALLVPAGVIKKVGLLDREIFMYGEDVDWSYRIKKAKYKVLFSPITKIVHIGSGSSGKVSKNAIVGEYKGIVYLYKKHKSFLSLQLLRCFLKIGALARIVIFALLGRKETALFYAKAFKVA